MQTAEHQVEHELSAKLRDLKYTHRPDLRDCSALRANFRQKFQELNKIRLTNAEGGRLLAEIITADVFTTAHTLRSRNSFPRDGATPLNTRWSTSPTGARTPLRSSASSGSTPTTPTTGTT
jgi:type I restriction enzyme R subunit